MKRFLGNIGHARDNGWQSLTRDDLEGEEYE